MLKKHLFYFGVLFASLFTITSTIESIQPVTDLSFVGGWRKDHVKTLINAEEPIDDPFLKDEFELNGINIWQVGLRGQFPIPNLCHHHCYDWLTQFYFKGHAYWGWGDSGSMVQRVRGLNSSSYDSFSSSSLSIPSGVIRGGAHGVHSQDFSVGFGWQYNFNNHWGIGPTVGYAWNKLAAKTRHPKQNDSSYDVEDYDSLHAGLGYSSHWKGPWLGLDLAYENDHWRFNSGYEYHWARWSGSYSLENSLRTACNGFSDTRKASYKYGNVAYFNGWYDFCYNWEFGIGLKYTYFRSDAGTENPLAGSFNNVGCRPDEFDKVKYTKWTSYEVTATLGYQF